MIDYTKPVANQLNAGRGNHHQRLLDLILFKTYAELKFEAKRTYVGFMWWIIEPVIFMLIFYFVFTVVFDRGTEDFVPFLLIGLITWHWIQSNVVQSCGAISGNQGLIQQVYVPKFVFPTVLLFSTTIKFLIVLILVVTYLVIYGITPTRTWLYAPVVLASTFLLIAGISYLVASITPLIPDIRILVDNAFRGLLFLSGIFYDIRDLSPGVARWLLLNPFAVLISDLRGALMYGEAPDLRPLAAIFLLSLALGALGIYIMHRNELRYAKTVL
jgi:lipopolysaccharide transport system permease protein